jgi:hypothetical protein
MQLINQTTRNNHIVYCCNSGKESRVSGNFTGSVRGNLFCNFKKTSAIMAINEFISIGQTCIGIV